MIAMGLIVIAAALALWLLEPALRGVMLSIAHRHPNDLCGPYGLLVDTKAKGGIFDRP